MSDRENLGGALSRMKRRRGFSRWTWWLISGFPVLFLVAGIGFLIEAAIFVSDAESARGKVIDVDASYDSDGGVSYKPLIRYRRDDGRSYEAETHIASGEYDYGIGERVDILYSPDDPGTVRIDSFFSLFGLGLVFAGVGALFVTILTFVRRKMSRPGGSVLAQAEAAAAEKWRAEAKARDEPRTTDPSQYGHVHEPKPKRAPTIRRMR